MRILSMNMHDCYLIRHIENSQNIYLLMNTCYVHYVAKIIDDWFQTEMSYITKCFPNIRTWHFPWTICTSSKLFSVGILILLHYAKIYLHLILIVYQFPYTEKKISQCNGIINNFCNFFIDPFTLSNENWYWASLSHKKLL